MERDASDHRQGRLRSLAVAYPGISLVLLSVVAAACGPDLELVPSVPVDAHWLDPVVLAEERWDSTWRRWAEQDRLQRSATMKVLSKPAIRAAAGPDMVVRAPAPTAASARTATDTALAWTESFEDITPELVNLRPLLPTPGGEGGPSALHIQILLDRARFSPGVLDGKWGKNSEKAIYWFQYAYGLPVTGHMDRTTYNHLAGLTLDAPPVRLYYVTAEVMEGPFADLPGDVYEQAELDCLCFESPAELLAERFHTTREVLAQLNPHLDLDSDSLQVGTPFWAPNLREPIPPHTMHVAQIVISKQGSYTQALNAAGEILFHFPSTLGSAYDPSPDGDFHVTSIIFDPYFHYQPALFHEVPDHEPTAMLPKGPNSPVGVVWMALSKAHYAIHGTSRPESVGHTSSHGCVRLTNWDARRLARQVTEKTPVEFR